MCPSSNSHGHAAYCPKRVHLRRISKFLINKSGRFDTSLTRLINELQEYPVLQLMHRSLLTTHLPDHLQFAEPGCIPVLNELPVFGDLSFVPIGVFVNAGQNSLLLNLSFSSESYWKGLAKSEKD